MPDNSPDIDDLLEKLNALLTRQDLFAKEINELRAQIISLKDSPLKTETESGKSLPEINPGSVMYALILIILGIWKDKKHLRIAAIVLFTVTLLKLFFYDITLLSTISKTIVFVVLGILLLIISFLYNKYTHKIT